MFIQKLMLVTGQSKLSFEIESKESGLIFTAIPQQTVPESSGAVAAAHAALAMPLRVTIENSEDADNQIIAELDSYQSKRNLLQSNLDVLNKVLADATKSVKQEANEKDSNNSEKPSEKKGDESDKSAAPATESDKKELVL